MLKIGKLRVRPLVVLALLLLLLVVPACMFLGGDESPWLYVDPEHPGRLLDRRHAPDAQAAFLCGPGDPEDLLHVNTRANIDFLIERGAKTTYIAAWMRDFGGGDPGTGRALKKRIKRWSRSIDRLEAAGIVSVVILYDDEHPRPDTWREDVDTVVQGLKHHPSIVWCIAEEYSEALSAEQVLEVAAHVRQLDDRNHLIAVHQLAGSRFDFVAAETIDMFMMQTRARTPEAVYAHTLEAWRLLNGRAILNMAEILNHARLGRDEARRMSWAAAMGGADMVQVLWMGRAGDPPDWNRPEKFEDCAHLTDFMNRADLRTMTPRPDLALTERIWMMGNQGGDYLAYGLDPEHVGFGMRNLEPGLYDLHWLDAVTGSEVTQSNVVLHPPPGDHVWFRPDGIGEEAACHLVYRGGLPADALVEPLASINMRFEREVFAASNGVLLPYRLYRPDTDAAVPLVLYLHGKAANGADNMRPLKQRGAYRWTEAEAQAHQSAMVLVPQCRIGDRWSSISVREGAHVLRAPTDELVATMELLEHILANEHVDRARIYLAGQSLGAYGGWALLMARPELFAAAILAAGAGDPSQVHLIDHIPIWMLHGLYDDIVPVRGAVEMGAALKAAGGYARLTLIEKPGHDVFDEAWGTPGIGHWLFSARKAPAGGDACAIARCGGAVERRLCDACAVN